MKELEDKEHHTICKEEVTGVIYSLFYPANKDLKPWYHTESSEFARSDQ